MWGSQGEAPSFIYAMPLGGKREGTTSRVFLEETCLVAKPPLPFAVLKRRLERRLNAVGITVKKVGSTAIILCYGSSIPPRNPPKCIQRNNVPKSLFQIHEEEWSYIPVGGPLPVSDQNVTAFGAAASLIHPATGKHLVSCLHAASR